MNDISCQSQRNTCFGWLDLSNPKTFQHPYLVNYLFYMLKNVLCFIVNLSARNVGQWSN